MAIVSAGLYAYELADDPTSPPATQTFYTRRSRLDANRPVVEVTDENGEFIGRLTADVGPVSWRVDSYGHAALDMVPATAAARRELIEFGNRVVIRWENGLPPWLGVIDPPLEHAPGRTAVNVYGLAYALGWELTERYDAYAAELERNTPDYILWRLVRGNRLGIRAFTVASDQPAVDIAFSYDDVLTAAGRLREQNESFHWHIGQIGETAWSPGLWTYYGWRRDRRGDARLVEGHNLINVETVEQGPIFNDVTVAAGNDDPADAVALPLVYRYARPSRYGARERYVPLPNVDIDLGTAATPAAEQITRKLEPAARAQYERYGAPRLRFRGVCLNRPPSPFGSYGLGDLVTVELNGYGRRRVEQAVTIVGMEFDPRAGYLTIVGEYENGELTL